MTNALPFGDRPAVCLAPMAGFTDRAFRSLCIERGADATTTEMISAKGLLLGGGRSKALYSCLPTDAPFIVQLFGREPDFLADAARMVQDDLGDKLLAVDLNMGCPAHKISGSGDGCALMREPLLAGRIVESVSRAVLVPVTVKLRKGWDEAHSNAVAFAKVCEDGGAAALTVHGRTREQLYAGRSDRACIAAVKRAVKIPVVANGDVRTGQDALALLRETACDGVMVGRGALGNPFVFEEIHAALEGRAYTPPSWEERREMALRHARLTLQDKGDHGMIELRKHLSFYVRGAPEAAKLRIRLNACRSVEELAQIWA